MGLADIIVLRTTPFVLHITHYFFLARFQYITVLVLLYTANKQTVLRSIPPPLKTMLKTSAFQRGTRALVDLLRESCLYERALHGIRLQNAEL